MLIPILKINLCGFIQHILNPFFIQDTQNSKQRYLRITYDRKRNIQYKLREVERFHQKEVEIIHNTIAKTSLPVIYCGDLNTIPSSYTYHILKLIFRMHFLKKAQVSALHFIKFLCFALIIASPTNRFNVLNCFVIEKNFPIIILYYRSAMEIKYQFNSLFLFMANFVRQYSKKISSYLTIIVCLFTCLRCSFHI